MRSSLGGEVYAPSEMVDHMLSLKDFFGPFEGMNPGAVGLEGCESLVTHHNTGKLIAEEYRVRHLLIVQPAAGGGYLQNAYWLPGKENPAGGLAKVRSDVVAPVFVRDRCAPSKVWR